MPDHSRRRVPRWAREALLVELRELLEYARDSWERETGEPWKSICSARVTGIEDAMRVVDRGGL